MSKIVVSGYYGSKNAGDEAMLAAMIEVLSELDPKLHITVISADPADTARRHGVQAIPWLSVGAIWAAIREADLVISGGGSLLQNVTSGRSLYYYLSVIFFARLLDKPVMLYAQGIGPVCGSFPRWLMRVISQKVSRITVRDRGSLTELQNLAVTRPPMEVTADPVLAIHPVDRGLGRTILTKYKAAGAKPVVGISVREWRGWQGYKKVIAAAAAMIMQELDARVVFLPMQYPEDVKTAETIAAMAEASVIVLAEEYTTSELLSIVGNLDLLVSIRLHGLIFAGVMGIPMVGISYDPKIDRFLDSIGDRPVGDLQTVTVENIMAAVREKWARRETLPRENEGRIAELRRLAARNAELALELIEKQGRVH